MDRYFQVETEVCSLQPLGDGKTYLAELDGRGATIELAPDAARYLLDAYRGTPFRTWFKVTGRGKSARLRVLALETTSGDRLIADQSWKEKLAAMCYLPITVSYGAWFLALPVLAILMGAYYLLAGGMPGVDSFIYQMMALSAIPAVGAFVFFLARVDWFYKKTNIDKLDEWDSGDLTHYTTEITWPNQSA